MFKYDFGTLNDKDFEELSRDLLQKELNITFESFKSGKDGGIDLRYSNPSNSENIVVQSKHYFKSGLSQLKSKLKSDELPKVQKLNPSRYIITTSVPLSPQDKAEIKSNFEPYIISTGDIYGQDDLNNLLTIFPEVEKNHHKLWFSSTTVIERILSNAIHGRSEFQKELILEKVKLFVKSKHYDRARQILENEKVLLITGEPGAGKTTLAEFLTWDLMRNGFELVYIDDNLKEAEEIFSNDPDKKQIFYFDDFLGSNYLEVSSEKNFDSKIVNFIRRIKAHKNRVFIMTTRTVILNKARVELEKLDKREFLASNYEINVGSYTREEKAQILYNHIFHSTVSEDLQEIIFKNGNYYKIIDHRNYNPRLIEFINSSYNVSASTSQEYLDFILNSLNNPKEVWNYVYENQTSDESKFLIMTLFSLAQRVNEEQLKKAFESRLNYEKERRGYIIPIDAFNKSIKLLLDGFIKRASVVKEKEEITYEFINPSISDFLISYLNKNSDEKISIIKSSYYIEQLTSQFDYISKTKVFFDEEEVKDISSCLEKSIIEYKLTSIDTGSKEIEIIYFIIKNFKGYNINRIIFHLLDNLEINKISSRQFDSLKYILVSFSKVGKLKSKILDIWDDLIRLLFDIARDRDKLEFILELFTIYKIDYKEFLEKNEDNYILDLIQDSIDSFWFRNIDSYIDEDEEINSTDDENKIKIIIENLRRDAEYFNDDFCTQKSPSFDEFSKFNVQAKIDENRLNMTPDDDMLHDEWKDSHYSDSGYIDSLFSK